MASTAEPPPAELAEEDNDGSSKTDAISTLIGPDTVMAEQTAHDVVKEAQSVGDVSSIDVNASSSIVAPAGNGEAQATSENTSTHEEIQADELYQVAQSETLPDTDAQAESEFNEVADSLDIINDDGDIQGAGVEASGGSDTDTSKDLKDPATGHVRSNSVKKPAAFKSVSVTKNFLAKTVTTPAAKLSDKVAASGTSPSIVPQTARPRLVAKSALGGLARTAVANGAAPDASKVWNKNRPTPPPQPRQFTDEELKQQYGIHMATRLQADEAGKESKWADIDDDEDDWAPETVEWMDGTKSSVVPTDAHATPSSVDDDKFAPMKERPLNLSETASDGGAPKPNAPPSNKTILKPGVHLHNLVKARNSAQEGSDSSSTAVKPMNATAKNPWAPLPPIDKVAPVFPQPPPQAPPSMSPFRRDPHGFDSMRPPPATPAREIAADDFNRTWMEDRGPRELFDSKSGRYEVVGETRRGSVRQDHGHRHPALLQRPSQNEQAAPAEPSAAFQTRSTGADGASWARRRASSNVSVGSGGRRFSIGRSQDERFDGLSPMRGSAIESPQQQFSAIDSGISPASVSQSGWPQSSPTFRNHIMTPGAQPSPLVNGDSQDAQGGPPDEDPVARQQRLMREKQEATRLRKQREREEEAREEAARKERLRRKMEALGGATPSPDLTEPRSQDGIVSASPEQPSATTIKSPPKPPVPSGDGEVAHYGMIKVHQPHPVRRGPNMGVGGENSIARKLMPEAPHPAETTTLQPQPNAQNAASASFASGKRVDSHTPLNQATWKSPSPSTGYNWGNNNNSANVWGPPQNNNRGLGNGTFNSDYNRLAGTIGHNNSSIGGSTPDQTTIAQTTIERPGPIAPPRVFKQYPPRSSSSFNHSHPTFEPVQSHHFSSEPSTQPPEHLIPSDLDNFDTSPISMGQQENTPSVAGNVVNETQQLVAAQNTDKTIQPEPEMQRPRLHITETFTMTAVEGSYGKRRALKTEVVVHDGQRPAEKAISAEIEKATTTESKPRTAHDNLASSGWVPPHLRLKPQSRFFPGEQFTSSTELGSTPPPGDAALFDSEDAKNPPVRLPKPAPKVKLPPADPAAPKVNDSAPAPVVPAVIPSAAETMQKIGTLFGKQQKPIVAQVASATKAPLDVATKETAKVALPTANTSIKLNGLETSMWATKPMASAVVFPEPNMADAPPVKLPKAKSVNADKPAVPMQLLNAKPTGLRWALASEYQSKPESVVLVQQGDRFSVYVKMPGQAETKKVPIPAGRSNTSNGSVNVNKQRNNGFFNTNNRRPSGNGNQHSAQQNNGGNHQNNNGARRGSRSGYRGGRSYSGRGNGKAVVNGAATSSQ